MISDRLYFLIGGWSILASGALAFIWTLFIDRHGNTRPTKIIFAWYDFWIGVYWDKKNRYLYIFLIPCIGIRIKRF